MIQSKRKARIGQQHSLSQNPPFFKYKEFLGPQKQNSPPPPHKKTKGSLMIYAKGLVQGIAERNVPNLRWSRCHYILKPKPT